LVYDLASSYSNAIGEKVDGIRRGGQAQTIPDFKHAANGRTRKHNIGFEAKKIF